MGRTAKAYVRIIIWIRLICIYRYTRNRLQLNHRTMGNQQASQTNLSLTKQERNDWVKVEDQGYCELWANKKTNRRFQAYPISEATARDNVQVEKYAFRKLHNTFLVSAQAVITQNQTFLCSEPITSFVLIQNITSRLTSFPRTFTFEESLYILSSSATGYNTLCSFFGPLEPNEDLICFNDYGNVKVWLNQNLSKNQASINAKSGEFEITKNEDYSYAKRRSRECVQKLLKIVENSTIQGFPRGFEDETRNLSTFFEISNFVDYFCEKNGLKIPSHIELNRGNLSNAGNSRQFVNTVSFPSRAQPPQYVQTVQAVQPVQPVQSLQSSRVNKVFQSNHYRQGLNPVHSLPPNQFANTQFRYPGPPIIQTNPGPQWVQNHQISYVFPPPNIHPVLAPAVITNVPIVRVSINDSQRLPNLEEVIKQNSVEVSSEPIQKLTIDRTEPNVECLNEPPVANLSQDIPTNNEADFQEQPQFREEKALNAVQIQQPHSYHEEDDEQYRQYQSEARNQQVEIENGQKYNEEEDNYQEEEPRFAQNQVNQQNQQEIYERYYKEQRELEQQIQIQKNKQLQQQREYEYQLQLEEQRQLEEELRLEEQRRQKDLASESIYSHIERYVPPPLVFESETIEQRQQQQIVSPQKKSFQIEQWEQKLNHFTQSKEKPQNPRAEVQPEPREVKVESKQPQSFKNLVVSEQKEEYVNELVDLENDDIEKYIRMKYQSYLNERSEPQSASNTQEYTAPAQNYRASVDAYRSTSYPTQYQSEQQPKSNDYYKPYEYTQQKWQPEARQKENLPNSYQYESYPIPINDTNRVSIDTDLQYASNSLRNEQKNYAYKYDKEYQQPKYDQYERQIGSKRVSERNKSGRTSNIIDQKYSKYVLNSQKPKRPTYNTNIEDVSLILPGDESNFMRQRPKPLHENSFDHQSFSYSKPVEKKGITYEKLSKLLWEQ